MPSHRSSSSAGVLAGSGCGRLRRTLVSSLAPLGLCSVLGTACSEVDPEPNIASLRAPVVTSGTSGGYNYRLFVPSSHGAGRPLPLVLMLHGCTQTPDAFAQATQMDALAESTGFLVAYPEQPTSANPVRCFRWFEPAHQARGAGEPAILAGIVDHIGKRYAIDADRVYAAGFSAGAGMSVILGATYPDVFAAIAVGSGLEYKAATSAGAAGTAMRSGGPNPQTQGEQAFRAMGMFARVVPTVVFHGSGDTTVAPLNADQVISQYAQTLDLADDGRDNGSIDDRVDRSETLTVPGGRRYTRSAYDDAAGHAVLEKYVVDGMSHAWSGNSGGAYTDARGPKQSALIWQFFRSWTRRGWAAPVDPADGGSRDAGMPDAATADAATADAATPDAATPDAATPDAGTDGGLPPRSVSVSSIDAEDGTAGALPIDGVLANTIKVGDKGLFGSDTFRGVLSFDAAALPTTVSPRSASLVLVRKSQQGSVSTITVDLQNGFFGRSSALEQADHSAAASAPALATATPPTSDGAKVEIALPVSAIPRMIAGGRIQLRLRATTPRDFAADHVVFHDGAGGPLAPRLVLQY